MKTASFFFLMLFVTFLVTPLIVNLLKNDGDAVIVMILEEENSKNTSLKLKQDNQFVYDWDNFIPKWGLQEQSPNYKYHRPEYIIFLDPSSPPPRLA